MRTSAATSSGWPSPQDRFALAGSETSTTAPGYPAGAADAAERAVAEVMTRLMAFADQG